MSPKQVDGEIKRTLPKKQNPLLAPDKTPELADLIKTRRLGQTDLSVKAGQVGVNNATQPVNLGRFDYAHLRAPLPDDLKGSQVFAPQQNQSPPTSYFLMRRSRDGFISATGMFKAAFPWAKHAEEEAEKQYIKSQQDTAQDEVAGNIWVSERYAIQLADEYGIVPWIQALLDPAQIQTVSDNPEKSIEAPPKFKFTAGDKQHLRQPNGTPARGARAGTPKSRGRPRAGSLEKKAGSPQKSTKKARPTKAQKEANAATAREVSTSLQTSLNDAASVVEGESEDEDTAKIDVGFKIETKGDVTTETTNVKFEMPKGAPELRLPESPEQMIEKAKEIVNEARKLDGGASPSRSKRKAEELDEETDGEGDDEPQQPAKRARIAEQQLRREKVRNRALLGFAATLAIGAAIPFLTG